MQNRYGLLGASGCGKTTVLSLIVGLKTIDKGQLRVFGGIPGDGYIEIPGKVNLNCDNNLLLWPSPFVEGTTFVLLEQKVLL